MRLYNQYLLPTLGPLIGHASDGDSRRRKLQENVSGTILYLKVCWHFTEIYLSLEATLRDRIMKGPCAKEFKHHLNIQQAMHMITGSLDDMGLFKYSEVSHASRSHVCQNKLGQRRLAVSRTVPLHMELRAPKSQKATVFNHLTDLHELTRATIHFVW